MRRPGAQRSTSAADFGAGGAIGNVIAGYTVASAAGGISACVTPHAASTSDRSSPTSGPGGGTTSTAPAVRDMHSSSTDASKLGVENCSTRSPGPTANRSTSAAAKLANPVWETTTPLGRPVEPDGEIR